MKKELNPSSNSSKLKGFEPPLGLKKKIRRTWLLLSCVPPPHLTWARTDFLCFYFPFILANTFLVLVCTVRKMRRHPRKKRPECTPHRLNQLHLRISSFELCGMKFENLRVNKSTQTYGRMKLAILPPIIPNPFSDKSGQSTKSFTRPWYQCQLDSNSQLCKCI